jgi:hypothetical protein
MIQIYRCAKFPRVFLQYGFVTCFSECELVNSGHCLFISQIRSRNHHINIQHKVPPANHQLINARGEELTVLATSKKITWKSFLRNFLTRWQTCRRFAAGYLRYTFWRAHCYIFSKIQGVIVNSMTGFVNCVCSCLCDVHTLVKNAWTVLGIGPGSALYWNPEIYEGSCFTQFVMMMMLIIMMINSVRVY